MAATIGEITVVLFLAVALASAVASIRSASAAREPAKQASRAERRAILRDVVIASQSIIGELGHVDFLANSLRRAYVDLAGFTGDIGRSHANLVHKRIDDRKAQFAEIADETGKFATDAHALHEMSSNDLLQAVPRLEAYRLRARYVREECETELASVENEILPHREKAISQIPSPDPCPTINALLPGSAPGAPAPRHPHRRYVRSHRNGFDLITAI